MVKYISIPAVFFAALLACSCTASAARLLQQESDGNITDADILNFALNLEYLEAELYLCAANGTGLPEELRGGGPPSIGCQKADLSVQGQEYADETALDELRHVAFLRAALGEKAVPMPLIDIGPAFAAAANAALGQESEEPFSPYENDITFYIGAFVFEDVGVTAYRGAIPLLQSVDLQSTAAGLMGTEAYHGGSIRTLLGQFRQVPTTLGPNVLDVVEAISNVRDAVDGPEDLDQGIELDGTLNVVPTDENSVLFSRDVDQVLSIVYLGDAATPGGFFPEGLNGVLA